jgi:hypothetical protein
MIGAQPRSATEPTEIIRNAHCDEGSRRYGLELLRCSLMVAKRTCPTESSFLDAPCAVGPPLHRLRCPRIGGASLQYRRQRLFTIGSGSIILNDRVWRTIHECKVISPAKRNGASRCRFRYNCSCARLAQRWWFRLRISSPLSVELWHQRKLGETWPIPPRQCGGRSIWKIHLYAGCSGE